MSGYSARRAGALAIGALALGVTRAAYSALCARPPGGGGRWDRVNHRGEPVTLLEGPAVAAGAAVAALVAPGLPTATRAAAVTATLGAGGFGVLDDLTETGRSKGLRGHLTALRRGEPTTGALKILGIGATGLAAGYLARSGTSQSRGRLSAALDLVADGALVAGTANLVNLFDLRPGRALKVSLLAAPAALAGGPAGTLVAVAAGAATAMLDEDLGERAMLGDAGANALGALLGTALVTGTGAGTGTGTGAGRRVRTAALATVVGLTLASEKISFTKVIASTPGLREFDALGRRPAVR